MKDGEVEVGGYLTGPGLPVFVTSLDPGVAAERHQDVQSDYTGKVSFGRDTVSPPVWKLQFAIGEGRSADEALAALAALQRAWRTAVDPRVPGEVTALRYGAAGRTRRVYGRPRNFTPDLSHSLEDGNVVATAEFVTQDAYHYSDVEQSKTLTSRPPATSYVTLPAVWPLLSSKPEIRQSVIQVGGDAPTPVRVEFTGPGSNPGLIAPGQGWEVQALGTFAYDETLVVDSRTEEIMMGDGTPAPGVLSRATYLPEVQLAPGSTELQFVGNDSTGSATATIRWRDAYTSF